MRLNTNDIDVLAVDDQKDILDLSKIFLERFDERLNIDTIADPEEALEMFCRYDAVISDYDMPEMTGLELLEEIRFVDEEFPFILYTGKGTEEVAEEAIKLDITDYFQKEAGTDQYQVIANKLVESVESYRESQEKDVFRSIAQNSDNPVIVTDSESNILYVNPALEEATGYSAEEMIGEKPGILNSGEHTDETFQEMYDSLSSGEVFRISEMTNLKKDGNTYLHNQQLIPIETKGDKFYAAISTLI